MTARRHLGRPLTGTAALLVGLAALPSAAPAHGLVQRANLPLPEWLFGWAAAVVLIVSFVALAILWRSRGSSAIAGARCPPASDGCSEAARSRSQPERSAWRCSRS